MDVNAAGQGPALQEKNTLIIAHRGASRLAHENTLTAFQKAIDLGADFMELDVRQSKDGVLVCFHDEKINGKKISSLTFGELNGLAAAQNFSVPTLAEALRLASGKIKVLIEIKTGGYEQKTVETALQCMNPEDFTVISFIQNCLKRVKQYDPKIKTGLILGARPKRWPQVAGFLVKRAEILSYTDMICLHWKLLKWGFASIIPKDLTINVWTVDEPDLMAELFKNSGVEAITTNVPDVALDLRKDFTSN